MIQTLPCPSCHRTLVLSAEPSLQSVLRCRHCSHQFVLGEMVEAEMGFWEVVDDPNASDAKVDDPGEAVTEDAEEVPEDVPEIELAKSDEYISPQMLINSQSEKRTIDWSRFEPITHEQYERMRRKARSPIWSVVSVLLGGLASIPIATLLIWHVLGKDPLQMGPTVARYAPWVVPTRFQPYMDDEDNLPLAPAAGTSGLPRVSNGETVQDRRAPGAFPTRSVDSNEEIFEDESTSGSIQESDTPSKDVFSIIGQVEKDLEAWNDRGDDRAIRNKIALETYSDLAALALAINQLPSSSPIRRIARTELQSVGQEVAQHIEIQNLIQSGSRFWLANHKEDLVGLAVVTSIDHIVEIDNAWQITPTTTAGGESLQITVPKDVFPSLSEGQIVLVIGCVTRAQSTENTEPSDLASNTIPMLTANYIYALKP